MRRCVPCGRSDGGASTTKMRVVTQEKEKEWEGLERKEGFRGA